jgi:uncharacterized protein (TIGR02246 family)
MKGLKTVAFLTVMVLSIHLIAQARERSVGDVATSQTGAVTDPDREPDRLAIAALTQSLVEAFDKRDAEAIAACWTPNGEFIRHDGEAIRGRAEIQAGYAEFFKNIEGNPKLEIQLDDVRFPSADVAATDVTLGLKSASGEFVASGHQAIVAVREGSLWKVAIIREWDRDISLEVDLQELQWLIGTWNAVSDEREVTIAYAWDENKTFIHGTFVVKEHQAVIESGTEIIGKDPAAGGIRSWIFQSDGGFGAGVWSRDGPNWSIDAHGVRADGSKLTAQFIYLRVNPDTITWQAVNQVLDGQPIADTAPIKVSRQTPSKQGGSLGR